MRDYHFNEQGPAELRAAHRAAGNAREYLEPSRRTSVTAELLSGDVASSPAG